MAHQYLDDGVSGTSSDAITTDFHVSGSGGSLIVNNTDTSTFDGVISGNTIDSGFEGLSLTDSPGTISDNRIRAMFTGINLSPVLSNVCRCWNWH